MHRLLCLAVALVFLGGCGSTVKGEYDGQITDVTGDDAMASDFLDSTFDPFTPDYPDMPAEEELLPDLVDAADTPDTGVDSPDIPIDSDEICTIDLVFCVDNSGSMGEEIRAFREDLWPLFADALIEVSGGLGGAPFHAAVLDACPNPANFHTRGDDGECFFESGQVWMESDSSDLVGEFQCVGDIYDDDITCSGSNDDEQPASVAATALLPPWITGVNAGFLRDDALLIVVAITDEDETPVPSASAHEVYERLIAAKGGDVSKMVFLGIGGADDCDGEYGEADEAEKLKDITDYFIAEDRGIFWDLCDGRLEDGLTEAMEVISLACSQIMY